ncbi:MAG: acetyl-CoA carboxylase biotin carboxylase subunit [Candidatus Granulicatella sp. P6S_S16_bin.50.1]|nr:acetyl-CoA carboxylase biotin carboxylase subunit [Candidatus Granulicatella sp. P6S_S16_bin.50.1]
MFNRVLIANRGEIACRIIRACRELGIESVAVYSQADKDALHVQLADHAVCIGPAASKDSYLKVENILSAAVTTGAQAIHPGFGFLSENAKFAKMCAECNITFIGPSSEVISQMGDKAEARKQMIAANVPVIPGSDDVVETVEEGIELAKRIGFPLLIKAVAGGGGKGIRRVETVEEFEHQFVTARQEALQAFGNADVYMERIIYPAKHIEFQILADQHGNVVHLGERDCSLQRKNQKIIEEAPSPSLSSQLRREMGEAAVRAAKAVGYQNAGTIEFLVDEEKHFYFMEMNTRIQVEHPITEMITNVDLVQQQIKIAAGEELPFTQEDITFEGHAIECRLNAENPFEGFRPSPGKVTFLHQPVGGMGVRIESALYTGYQIPPFYDSMLTKLIAHGKTREEAILRMKRMLFELVVEGVDTNQEFVEDLLDSPAFRRGDYTTAYVETEFLKYWNQPKEK